MTDEVEVLEAIKKSFKALVDEPGFIGLYILPTLLLIISTIYPWGGFENVVRMFFMEGGTSFFIKNIFWIFIFFLFSIVLITIATAGIILKTEVREKGKYLGFSEAISQSITYIPQLFIVMVLAGLIIAGPLFASILLFFIFPSLAAVVSIIWIIPMIYIGIRLSLVSQVCVLEDLGPIDSLKTGWQVTKGEFWLIFTVVVIFILLNIPLNLISYLIPFYLIRSILDSFIVPLILGSASTIALTLVYLGVSKKPE